MKHPLNGLRNAVRTVCRLIAGRLDAWSGGRITPNDVTTVGVAMHLPIAYFIAQGEFGLSAVLLIIFGLFDVLDGELARLQKTASLYGMVYDATTDRIKETLIYAGLAYYLSMTGQAEWTVWIVLAAGLSISVSYAKAKGEVALAVRQKWTDYHALNRYFSEGLVAYELRISLLILGLILHLELVAVAGIAVMSIIMNVVILFVIKRALSAATHSS